MGQSDTGKIVTTSGPISPSKAGVTLPHEHIFLDTVADKYEQPESAFERRLAEEPISLENLWWIRQNPMTHKNNMRLDSMEDAVKELSLYKQAGGRTVVDVTPKNMGGDPARVAAIARQIDIHIVHGTAYYMRSSHPDGIDNKSVDELADEFVDDIQNGIDETDVRAGIIGEIGLSNEIHPQEEKVLRGAARAALRTGAPVSIHTPFERTPENPTSRRSLWALDIVVEEELPADRVILCHRDQSKWQEEDLKYRRRIADRGAYVEFDLFGHDELYHYDQEDGQPSDFDRVSDLIELINDGHQKRLLVSHDIFLKQFLTRYGGHGYRHILANIVPVLRARGVTEDTIETIIRENPQRLLSFESPS